MPLYEFICEKCKHEFEDLISMKDAESIKCPKCNKNVKRKISKSAFHLKGGGWADTGYSKEVSKPDNDEGTCVRIPQYKDKNTGAVGLGNPEIAND